MCSFVIFVYYFYITPIKNNTNRSIMRLTKAAILAIRGGKDTKKRLAEDLGVSEPTIFRWLADNDDNLTKAAALKVIREETGLTNEDILEVETESEAK